MEQPRLPAAPTAPPAQAAVSRRPSGHSGRQGPETRRRLVHGLGDGGESTLSLFWLCLQAKSWLYFSDHRETLFMRKSLCPAGAGVRLSLGMRHIFLVLTKDKWKFSLSEARGWEKQSLSSRACHHHSLVSMTYTFCRLGVELKKTLKHE